MTIYKLRYFLLSVLIGTLLFQSCKKEYTKYPYNNIEQFIVTDPSGNQLKAVIGEDNTILLYWTPFETVPDSITPVITLSKQATISPASGVKVAFKEGIMYTVTAQDGSKSTYTLKPAINTPAPAFSVTNSSLSLGDILILNGEYMIPDTTRTKLYLTDKNNKDIQLNNFSQFYSTTIHVAIPLTVDTGSYHVKLVSGTNTIIHGPYYIGPLSDPFANNTTYSYIFNEAGHTVSKGAELSFNYTTSGGSVADYFLPKQRLWLLTSGDDFSQLYDLEISSLTSTTVKFRLPADIPGGMILLYIYVNKGDGNTEVLFPFEGDPATYIAD